MSAKNTPKSFPVVAVMKDSFPRVFTTKEEFEKHRDDVNHIRAAGYRVTHTRNAPEITGAHLGDFDDMVEPLKSSEIVSVSEDKLTIGLKNGQTLRVTKEWSEKSRPQVGSFVIVRGLGRYATFAIVSAQAHARRFAPATGDLQPQDKNAGKGPVKPHSKKKEERDSRAREQENRRQERSQKRLSEHAQQAAQQILMSVQPGQVPEDRLSLSMVKDVKVGPIVTLGMMNLACAADNATGDVPWMNGEREVIGAYFQMSLGEKASGKVLKKKLEENGIVYWAVDAAQYSDVAEGNV